ncbi:MAG: Na+/H+ antiporter NhaA [Gammaproteobacteria bacterium]|nr:Na+/H+ antiporter NhaA [Gammaproteobacteria bacterium]
MRINHIKKFLSHEAASGVFLLTSAVLAFVLCNSRYAEVYQGIWQTPFTLHLSHYSLIKPLLFWVNEGFMTLFFLLVGLELKREFMEGQLSHISQIVLPGLAALGGMVVPALIYSTINHSSAAALQGWAVPVATDIAFALGVLSLFGKRVPLGLKLFLLALAIIDDIGAIVIISLFHTNALVWLPTLLALIMTMLLITLNVCRVKSLFVYLILGFVLWLCLLQSGIHATIAGIIVAFVVPLRKQKGKTSSPALLLEKRLHPWVAYFIMPLFAFANAGLSVRGLSSNVLTDSVTMGTVLGLFLGKQVGVLGVAWLVIKAGWAKLPHHTTWLELYGVAILCGIGFTMSLFLGTLAFQENNPVYLLEVRLGVLIGSIVSAVIGAMMLQFAFYNKAKKAKS